MLPPEPEAKPAAEPERRKPRQLSCRISDEAHAQLQDIVQKAAHFVQISYLPRGRGGKATMEGIIKAAVGAYWRDLERTWLAKHDPEELERRDAARREEDEYHDARVEEVLAPARFRRTLASKVEAHLARAEAEEES